MFRSSHSLSQGIVASLPASPAIRAPISSKPLSSLPSLPTSRFELNSVHSFQCHESMSITLFIYTVPPLPRLAWQKKAHRATLIVGIATNVGRRTLHQKQCATTPNAMNRGITLRAALLLPLCSLHTPLHFLLRARLRQTHGLHLPLAPLPQRAVVERPEPAARQANRC